MDQNKKAQLKKELVSELGWSEEQVENFLSTRVGTRAIQVNARFLLPLLQELSRVGIPFGTSTVQFLVPQNQWEAFAKIAAQVIAPHGGMVFTPEEMSLLQSFPAEAAD